MACPRLLCIALLLSPCLACQGNTIELETMEGSGSAGGDATASGTTADATTTGPGPITITATITETATADDDSADEGGLLDMGMETDVQTLLLAIDTVLSPGLPLQGIVWLQRGGAGTVNVTLQWLSLDQGSTTAPRELVGDVYAYVDIPVDPDGTFTWETGVVLVPGEANPITGSEVVLAAVAQVAPLGSPYCGRVAGELMSPIQADLEGSTHAMTSVPSELELPLEFPVSCP